MNTAALPNGMSWMATVLAGFARGCWDSLNLGAFARHLVASQPLRSTVSSLVAFNCVLLLGIYALLFVLPFLPIDRNGQLATLLASIFSVMWIVPMYAMTQLLGVQWYDSMYRVTSRLRHGDVDIPVAVSFNRLSELLLKFVVTLLYGVLAVVVALIPHLGFALSFMMASWLHAFYCFDYRLTEQQEVVTVSGPGGVVQRKKQSMSLERVLQYFEGRWSYFFGFGATHIGLRVVVLEHFLGMPLFASLTVCNIIFGLNVVCTVDANPGAALRWRVPMFSPFFVWLSRLIGRRRKDQIPER